MEQRSQKAVVLRSDNELKRERSRPPPSWKGVPDGKSRSKEGKRRKTFCVLEGEGVLELNRGYPSPNAMERTHRMGEMDLTSANETGVSHHPSYAGARLDRLPICSFHYRLLMLIGVGPSFGLS